MRVTARRSGTDKSFVESGRNWNNIQTNKSKSARFKSFAFS